MIKLPEFDHIAGLIDKPGTYALERWPATVEEQIAFLYQVAERWSFGAKLYICLPRDGYPGCIQVEKAAHRINGRRG